ncbi:hypothetical protein JNUCC23_20880 [Peribacillus sp. JNUCC 23]
MNSKQWMKRFFLTTLIVIVLPVSVVSGFNFWIDPLWNFPHKNEYNDYQVGFDERQQKTNFINSRKFDYDSLMIGTSRVTYMDAKNFEDERVFNYSLSSLHIDEYLPYIDYVTSKNKKDFDTIYMELYYNSYNQNEKNTNQDPSIYIEKSEEPFYKYTSLFSYSTLEYSLDNYKFSKENKYPGPRSYTRDLVAQTSYSNDRLPALWDRFEKSFKAEASTPFVYDKDYKNKLLELRNAYPDTKFVVFTEPAPAKRLNLVLSNEDQKQAYDRWYKDMVNVFGEVYSFQGETPITTNLDYYFDWFHYYPVVGDMMIDAIEAPKKHKDILYMVNKENVDEYLSQFE